ncbi:MAG: SRPBCC family protein [Mycobacteriales bacterium]
MPELTMTVDIDAPRDRVWNALVDWDRQGEWMLLTEVRGGHGAGEKLEAYTGKRPLGFLDTMTITDWQPLRRAEVLHTGRLVRGSAAFELEELPDGRTRFIWSEWLILPLGIVGELGFRIVRPLFVAGIAYSLRKFARWAPGHAPTTRALPG